MRDVNIEKEKQSVPEMINELQDSGVICGPGVLKVHSKHWRAIELWPLLSCALCLGTAWP